MSRREFIGGATLSAMLLASGLAPAQAQEPIVFGVITPLSPPGETALGQQAKRGAEIAVEYLNEKGGVLGRKVVLSIHDSAGKNEQGVAAYRRLVSSEKAVAVFGFIHSGVNIAVNEVAKEMGVPTMGTQTGASDVTAKKYDIAFRTHAVDPPRAATWLGWIQEEQASSASRIVAETTDYGIGLAKETEKQNKEHEPRPRDPDDHVRSHDDRSAAAAAAGQGLQAGRHRQCRRRPAARPDDHAGDIPSACCRTSQMVTSYDAPARPQYWQLHSDKGVGVHFIAFYSPKSKLSATSARSSPSAIRRSSTSRRSMRR